MQEELKAGQVRVLVGENFKDPETQYAYYNGDEVVVDGRTASRMANEYNVTVLEEGPPSEEAQARHDAMVQAQSDAQGQQSDTSKAPSEMNPPQPNA
jgi:hypothetical protein